LDSRLVLPLKTVLDGNYRILRVVAAGGFGITYEAEDLSLGTMVAIKEYYPVEFGDRDRTMSVRPKSDRHKKTFDWGRSNFLEEARTLARFEHPSIVRVTRVFEANSTAYMVMRFEVGLSFENWLCSLGRAPTQEEMDAVLAPLLEAIQLMHDASFLHRDIAPDNIIIRPDGSPVLLDFGAARRAVAEMSRSLTGIVKAGYSPHEQYASDGRLQGPWSDIYALGATLYRAVVGRPPEESTLRYDEDRMPSAAEAARGRYRPAFLGAIDACLRVRHSERPQSMAQVAQMLFSTGRSRGSTKRPMSVPAKSAGSRNLASYWPAAAAVVVVAGSTYGGILYSSLNEPRQRVEVHAVVETRKEPAPPSLVEPVAPRTREEPAASDGRMEPTRSVEPRSPGKNEADERAPRTVVLNDEDRATYVRRIQELLRRSQCYDGKVTGRSEDAQEGLNRFVDSAGRKGGTKPARIQLAKASTSDFESWLKDAGSVEDNLCAIKSPPKVEQPRRPVERVARPVPREERPAAPRAPRYSAPEGGGGGGGAGLIMGIGN
jgi:serine/threonine protein kinase